MLAAVASGAAAAPGQPAAGCPTAATISAATTSVVSLLASDGPSLETATAFSIGSGRFVTVAHAVAGARDIRIGAGTVAGVIALDLRRDLAVVAAPGLLMPALGPARGAAAATSCAVVIAARGGQAGPIAGMVLQSVQVSIDIPVAARRAALELGVDLRRGDSGSPVIDGSGAVEGVVFAVSRDVPSTGWAVAASELRDFLDGLP